MVTHKNVAASNIRLIMFILSDFSSQWLKEIGLFHYSTKKASREDSAQ